MVTEEEPAEFVAVIVTITSTAAAMRPETVPVFALIETPVGRAGATAYVMGVAPVTAAMGNEKTEPAVAPNVVDA